MIARRTTLLILTTFVMARGASGDLFDEARYRMVEEEIVAAGVTDSRVIHAMRSTPRHEFVPLRQRKYAYFDMALPIGERQTISPPFVVAYMTEQLDPQPRDRVLEIGTGSGYQAAVLSPLVDEVFSIEIVAVLGRRAARTLKQLHFDNVHVKVGDGFQGWPEHAPFDKIIVTCSPEQVPEALVGQLKEGGLMVVPVGERYQQTLYLFTKKDGQFVSKKLLPTLFVPMTGAAEERRIVLPDPADPKLVNGSFEDGDEASTRPRGWHYTRQMTLVQGALDAREGSNYVTFKNELAGRGSQTLQGFAVDGRIIADLNMTLWVKGEALVEGQNRSQRPQLMVTFYDDSRATLSQVSLGPWLGTFDWRKETRQVPVPLKAREAILHIGLLGAVGQISFDDLRMEAVEGR